MSDAVPEFGTREPDRAYRDRPSVYGVARDGRGRVAICRYPKGYYLPGGGVDAGETLKVALVREVREELGLVSAVGAEIGVAIQHVHAPGEGYFSKIGHFFHMQLGEVVGEGEPDHELVWRVGTEAQCMLKHGFLRWAVARALSLEA